MMFIVFLNENKENIRDIEIIEMEKKRWRNFGETERIIIAF